MSAINGDKARFHRHRKKKIHRREQQQKLVASLAVQKNSATLSSPHAKENS